MFMERTSKKGVGANSDKDRKNSNIEYYKIKVYELIQIKFCKGTPWTKIVALYTKEFLLLSYFRSDCLVSQIEGLAFGSNDLSYR